MPVYYDSKNEKYYVMFYAKDIRGINRKYKKTEFKKKKDTQNYEINFKKKISYSYDMNTLPQKTIVLKHHIQIGVIN